MSSVDSPGVCLSTERSPLSMSNETGQALTEPSISVENLSLTNISYADNSYLQHFSGIPTLLTLPQEEAEIRFIHRPPQLLSMVGKDTTTSGVTTSMEGTLDDIPDFQETAVPVAIEPEVNELVLSPPQKVSSPSSPHKSPGTQSTPSVNQVEAEARFIDEVKRTIKGRRPSSAKSFASTTGPKTSTSGVTVVEVKTHGVSSHKPPVHSSSVALSNQPSEDDISEGILNGNSQSGFSDIEASADITSYRDASEISAFAKFKPALQQKKKKPFLLRMPSEEEFDDVHEHHEGLRHHDNVLTERKAPVDLNKQNTTKSWRSLENESQISKEHKGYYKVVYVDKHNKKHSKRRSAYQMDSNGIKQIVSDEMNAVVTMQNDIWHKILDSFVNKNRESSHVRNRSLPPKKETINGEPLTMLCLPKEDNFYKPLDIPILKPAEKPKVFLTLPSEPLEDKLNAEIDQNLRINNSLNEVPGDAGWKVEPSSVNVSIQTSEMVQKPETKTESCQVEGIPEVNETKSEFEKITDDIRTNSLAKKQNASKQSLSQPLVNNSKYQNIVNQSEIPRRAIEECKILLESIQNSANELKEIKKNFQGIPSYHKNDSETEKTPLQSFHRNRHEIFLENFFGNPKRTGNHKFLDVQDITRISESGYFHKKKIADVLPQKALLIEGEAEHLRTPESKSFERNEANTSVLLSSSEKVSLPRQPDIEDKSAPFTHEVELPKVKTETTANEPKEENHEPSIFFDRTENDPISDSLSSVDKYLSKTNSSSDRTITLEDHILISPRDNAPEVNIPISEVKDLGVIEALIHDNISHIKQNFSTARSHEYERYKKVNLLLQSRKKVLSPTFSQKSPVKSTSHYGSSKHSQRPTLPMGETRTMNKAHNTPDLDIKLHAPSNNSNYLKKSNIHNVSLTSGTTSIPTNTDDLIDAALAGSEVTLSAFPPPLTETKIITSDDKVSTEYCMYSGIRTD